MNIKHGKILYIVSDKEHTKNFLRDDEILYEIDLTEEFDEGFQTDWIVFAGKYAGQFEAHWNFYTTSGAFGFEWGTLKEQLNRYNVYEDITPAIEQAKDQAIRWIKAYLEARKTYIEETKVKIDNYTAQIARIGTDYDKVLEACTKKARDKRTFRNKETNETS